MAREPSRNGLTYRDAGVDIDAGNALVQAIGPLARSTARPGADAVLGGFGGLFDLRAAGFSDPILVASTDGVGTKLKLAIAADKHDTIGIDLVAMCVNDIVVQGAAPLFFLDYYAVGRLDPAVAERVIAGIAEGCRQANCALIGGETAEMPGIYSGEDYDLAGFAVGAAERDALIDGTKVTEGDILLGLASSGIHANGVSLVRKIIEHTGAPLSAPAPFAPDQSLAEALLHPTRIYVRACLAALAAAPGAVHAMAHITGGGLVENVPRVLPDGLSAQIDVGAWPRPAVFRWLAEAGGVSPEEMWRTFNCGIGMVLAVAADVVPQVTATLTAEGETVHRIGVVEKRVERGIVLSGEPG